jgi:cell division protein FtsW (lipid II flippase)
MGRMLLLFLALAAAVSLATGKYWIIAAAVLIAFGFVLLVVPVINNRHNKRFMADLRKLNRGNMDLQSDWIKKPWQHEEGECKRQKSFLTAQIEAYAAKSAAERESSIK